MSTITAVRKNNQIAIACDTLIKWGSEKNSAKYVVNHNKIIQVKDSYLAVTGAAAGVLALRHYFNHTKDAILLHSVDEIFITFRNLQQQLKEYYHLEIHCEESGFEPNTFYVLIANPHGIFAVGSHRDIQEFDRFYAYGSGNEFALGEMYQSYDQPELSAEQIACLGIEAAAEFDDATALPLISYTFKAQS